MVRHTLSSICCKILKVFLAILGHSALNRKNSFLSYNIIVHKGFLEKYCIILIILIPSTHKFLKKLVSLLVAPTFKNVDLVPPTKVYLTVSSLGCTRGTLQKNRSSSIENSFSKCDQILKKCFY